VSIHAVIAILIVSSAFCCWIQSIVISGARRSPTGKNRLT
jgi:hypothetical protein